jgi:hypothetical protein
MLAFEALELSSALGQVASCIAQSPFCPGGFSDPFYYNTLPVWGVGAFLVVVATVLFLMAHRSR